MSYLTFPSREELCDNSIAQMQQMGKATYAFSVTIQHYAACMCRSYAAYLRCLITMLTKFYWRRELQQVWNKDAFLRSGGTAKTSKRRGENFNELYAACHAAEDKLKGLTLKHGKAAKGTLKGKQQQENVAPTDKRRDALRCLDESLLALDFEWGGCCSRVR